MKLPAGRADAEMHMTSSDQTEKPARLPCDEEFEEKTGRDQCEKTA